MTKKTTITRCGLPNFLPSNLRTVKLKALALKRSKRLNILRKYIENVVLTQDEKLKTAIKKLSIESFAQLLGLKSGTWSRLERADSCLSIEAAQWISLKVLEKFNVFVTKEWLLAEQECNELPLKVDKKEFDIYAYLKDIYQLKSTDQNLSIDERRSVEDFITQLVNNIELENQKEVYDIICMHGNKFLSESEVKQTTKILNSKKIKNSYKEYLEAPLRKLIMSSDISLEGDSKKLLLCEYFMIDIFRKMQPNSNIAYVRDKKMSPIYIKGDVVGGVTIPFNNISGVEAKQCIIELKSSVKLVRTVHLIGQEIILAVPANTLEKPDVLRLDDINSISVVVFRYKNCENQLLAAGDDSEKFIELGDF